MRHRPAGLLAVCWLLAACTPSALQNNQTAPTVIASGLADQVLPILPVSDELTTVRVRLQGAGDYRFVLDTGATTTAVFGNPRIDALGLSLSGDFPVSGVGGGAEARASFASPVDVAVGGVEIQGMTPVYLNWRHLPFFHAEDAVFWDGVLGYDLYSRVAVEVDPAARTVRLHPAGTDFFASAAAGTAAGATAGAAADAAAVRVPLQVEGAESFVQALVQVSPDGPPVPVKLHVDTGKRDALSLIAGRHPGIAAPAGATVATRVGLSGETRNPVARIAAMELVGLRLTGVKTSFVASDTGAFTHGADGRIGAALLNRFRYIVDYPGRQLVLVPMASTFESDPPRPSAGLGLFAIGADLDELVVVRAEAPAQAAGLKPGDIVVSIDAVPAPELSRGRWPALLDEKQTGDRLVVCLRPDSGADCREIELVQGV